MSEETTAPQTVPRAFELPLARAEAAAWQLIRDGWKKSVELANWCVEELRRLDADPVDERGKLRKLGECDLYARAFGRSKNRKGKSKTLRKPGFRGWQFFAGDHPSGGSQEASGIVCDVEDKYRAERLEVHVRRSQKFSEYDSYPWTLNGQSVKDVGLDGNGRPWVLLRMPGGDVKLQMRNGREFAPQMARFHDLVRRTEAARGRGEKPAFKEVVLRDKRCRGGDVMVKFVCDVPVRERRGDRPLVLSLRPDCFWAADFIREGVGEHCFVRAWVLNNDHWRGVAARHAKHLSWLKRMAQDAKAERRFGGNKAKEQARRLEIACEKDRNRLASFTHEAAAQLAGFCERNGVGEVFYLDGAWDRGFMTYRDSGEPLPFPWHQLHAKLEQKLTQSGIELHSESTLLQEKKKKASADVPQGYEAQASAPEGGREKEPCPESSTRTAMTRVTALRLLIAARASREASRDSRRTK